MSSTLFIWEAANLFVGSNAVPDYDKSLVIETVHIPDLEENVAMWHPGGSYGALEVGGLGLKELQLEFKCAGTDPQTMTQFGLFGQAQTVYTIRRATRNKLDNSMSMDLCTVRGRMKKITFDNYKRGDLYGQSYAISEIISYTLIIDGQEFFAYDFFGHIWRVQGISQIADVNSALGIASGGG